MISKTPNPHDASRPLVDRAKQVVERYPFLPLELRTLVIDLASRVDQQTRQIAALSLKG